MPRSRSPLPGRECRAAPVPAAHRPACRPWHRRTTGTASAFLPPDALRSVLQWKALLSWLLRIPPKDPDRKHAPFSVMPLPPAWHPAWLCIPESPCACSERSCPHVQIRGGAGWIPECSAPIPPIVPVGSSRRSGEQNPAQSVPHAWKHPSSIRAGVLLYKKV